MIHVGQNYSPMRSIPSLLKRGDIVTHMYAPPPNSILDDQGHLFPDVSAARRRGVIFDFGNGGGGHFSRPARSGGEAAAPPLPAAAPAPPGATQPQCRVPR
jgi:predicted amidohydrolase